MINYQYLTVKANSSLNQLLEDFENHLKAPNVVPLVMVEDEAGLHQCLLSNGDLRRLFSNFPTVDGTKAVSNFFKPNSYIKGSLHAYSRSQDAFWSEVRDSLEANSRLSNPRVDWVAVEDKAKVVGFIPWPNEVDISLDDIDLYVHGLGFVGLSIATLAANCGFRVFGVDTNNHIIESLKRGVAHFLEKGLDQSLNRAIASERLRFDTEVKSNLDPRKNDIHIVCVGTNYSNGHADTASVAQVLKRIVNYEHEGGKPFVLIRSTVALGDTQRLIQQAFGDEFKAYAFCPERLAEGAAIEELLQIPQLIGPRSSEVATITRFVFESLGCECTVMDNIEAAELAKLALNTVRDVTFSVTNSLIPLASKYQIDLDKMVKQANNKYPRTLLAKPSHVVGGYCLTKDPLILASSYPPASREVQWLESGREINSNGLKYGIEELEKQIKKLDVTDLVVALIGMAFKGSPETDDMRGNSVQSVIELLSDRSLTQQFYLSDSLIADEKILQAYTHRGVTVEQPKRKNLAIFILNNHPLNPSTVLRLIKFNNPIFIFDPWKLLNPKNQVKITNCKYANLCSSTNL